MSFIDKTGVLETVTSLPFGPVPGRPAPLPESTLVSSTGQSASATGTITGRYDMGFELGDHGQGYEISSVSIDLAAVPSSLTVSLWMDLVPRRPGSRGATTKLFDFENRPSFKVGLNKFTAPAGAFAYQNVDYFIVLSDFGSSLKIKETTSDDEDAGGETGATLGDSVGSRDGVLRLAVKGSKRQSGILASNYAQVHDEQENRLAWRQGRYRNHCRNSGSLPHPRCVLQRGQLRIRGDLHHPVEPARRNYRAVQHDQHTSDKRHKRIYGSPRRNRGRKATHTRSNRDITTGDRMGGGRVEPPFWPPHPLQRTRRRRPA